MAVKVPGSLGGLQYIAENTFGVTPGSTDFGYFGFMNTMSGTGGAEIDEQLADGSRIFDVPVHTVRSAGFDTTLSLYRDGTDSLDDPWYWRTILTYAYNAAGDIPSFTALMKLASDQYVMYRGCKIDTLELSAEGVGDKITARVSAKALLQMDQQASVAALGTDMGVTLGNENAGPVSKIPITFNAYPTMTRAGATASIPARNFRISIQNHLEEAEGIVSGKAYTAGEGLLPQECDIELEYEVLSISAEWDNLKLDADTDTWASNPVTITHTIGSRTFTFTGCYIMTDDHPSRSQGTYTETIRFKAKAMSVV